MCSCAPSRLRLNPTRSSRWTSQPRKSKKRTRGKPSEAARARKNAKENKRKRAKFKKNGGVRPDGTPYPTRNDRKKKSKTRREAEARAAVRAVVSHRTSVPAEIGQLTSLEGLDLSRNRADELAGCDTRAHSGGLRCVSGCRRDV